MAELGRVTIFVGAEVVKEAGVPAADEVADELIGALVRPRWAADELRARCGAGPTAAADPDRLRLELLLLWIADVYDEELAFFDFVDDVGPPTDLLRRLATAAVGGAQVVTTNVDDLLERAIAEVGGVAHTVDHEIGRASCRERVCHNV